MSPRRGPNPPGPVGGVGRGNPPGLSVGWVVDRIPLARWVGLAVEIPLVRLAGLAVGRIPPARWVALADGATASGCCANRHSDRARL